jgi:xanthine/CO dehydrogenase XdhC/CoxF family maturation factor
MLVAAGGQTWGTISGGCLERDVARRARGLIAENLPAQIVCYETDREDGGEEDARPVPDPGPSLGCGGRIEILIEPLPLENPGPMLALQAVVRQRKHAAIATVIRASSNAVATGSHLVQIDREKIVGSLPDSALHESIARHLASESGPFQLDRRDLAAGGWADVLIEWLHPAQAIAIFGDGHDVAPLVEIAATLGWHITVVGSRSQAHLDRQFPKAQSRLWAQDVSTIARDLPPDTAAVVMGHNFSRDSAALAALLASPRAFIGVLGPRRRTARLLAAHGHAIENVADENLYSPVGLDLGAENPEQVALSIIAEIQSVAAGGSGQSLRARSGPIHAIPPAAGSALARE